MEYLHVETEPNYPAFFLAEVADKALEFAHHDRVEDATLGQFREAITDGTLTVPQIVSAFRKALIDALG